MRRKLSVFILTYNEGSNIRSCLESLKDLSDDVHIADSYSSDDTLAICREYGCQIHQRKFDTFAKQCNWALRDFPLKYEWILRLDADERIPPQLAEELMQK